MEKISDVQYKNTGSKASLLKTGDGTLTLTNANKYYSGKYNCDGGILLLNILSGSGTGTGTIQVNPGGTIGGTGFVSGKVMVEAGAVLSPGDHGIGNFTTKNDVVLMADSYLSIDVNSYDKSADILIVNGKLKLGGILYLMDLGSGFSVGDHYKIVHTNSCSGKFSDIIPSTPGYGMKWDTTGFTVTGYISVAAYTSIASEKQNIKVGIYPNPASNKLIVSISGWYKKFNLAIEDIHGERVFALTKHETSNLEIDLSSFPPGTYTLVIHSGKQFEF